MEASLLFTVTADDVSFESGALEDGDAFRFTFDKPDTYAHSCRFYSGSAGSGMSRVVIVMG
jgi:hypothetical protein